MIYLTLIVQNELCFLSKQIFFGHANVLFIPYSLPIIHYILFSYCAKIGLNPFIRSSEEVENVSANQRPGRPYWISNRLKKLQHLVVTS